MKERCYEVDNDLCLEPHVLKHSVNVLIHTVGFVEFRTFCNTPHFISNRFLPLRRGQRALGAICCNVWKPIVNGEETSRRCAVHVRRSWSWGDITHIQPQEGKVLRVLQHLHTPRWARFTSFFFFPFICSSHYTSHLQVPVNCCTFCFNYCAQQELSRWFNFLLCSARFVCRPVEQQWEEALDQIQTTSTEHSNLLSGQNNTEIKCAFIMSRESVLWMYL